VSCVSWGIVLQYQFCLAFLTYGCSLKNWQRRIVETLGITFCSTVNGQQFSKLGRFRHKQFAFPRVSPSEHFLFSTSDDNSWCKKLCLLFNVCSLENHGRVYVKFNVLNFEFLAKWYYFAFVTGGQINQCLHVMTEINCLGQNLKSLSAVQQSIRSIRSVFLFSKNCSCDITCIRGSAKHVLCWGRSTTLSYVNIRFSGTCPAETPQPIYMKFCTSDHVGKFTRLTQHGWNRLAGGGPETNVMEQPMVVAIGNGRGNYS
jgi:hypothetical protein